LKGHHLGQQKTIRCLERRSWTTSHKMSSRNATNNGSTSGKGVCRHKGCT
jgi:hypothetical protein